MVQQSSGIDGSSTPDHQVEVEAKAASSAFAQEAEVHVSSRTSPALAFNHLDDHEDQYQDNQANVEKDRGLRGRRSDTKSPQSAARDVKREIGRMVDDAKAGKYRSSSMATKQSIMKRFYRLREAFRSDEMATIETQLQQRGLSNTARQQLLSRKRAIFAERSRMQGALDEGLRTPRGQNVTVQKEMIRGGEAHHYHETRPGIGSFTKPDYSVTATSEIGGRIRLHVNLKSHKLTDLALADAKAIARGVTNQAVKNAYGSQIKSKAPRVSSRAKTGDVGHLSEGNKIIVDFIDQPAPEIQRAMAEEILAEGSPVVEVRFGSAAFRRHAVPSSPNGAGTSQLPGLPRDTPGSRTSEIAPAVDAVNPLELKTTNASVPQPPPVDSATHAPSKIESVTKTVEPRPPAESEPPVLPERTGTGGVPKGFRFFPGPKELHFPSVHR